MTPTLCKLLACAAALGGIVAGVIVFDLPRYQRGSFQAEQQKPTAQASPHRALVPHRVVRDEAPPMMRRQAKCQMYSSEAQSGGADSHQSRGPGAWLDRLAEKTVAAARPKPPRCAAGFGIVAALTEEPGS
jgi:hypothetical protein